MDIKKYHTDHTVVTVLYIIHAITYIHCFMLTSPLPFSANCAREHNPNPEQWTKSYVSHTISYVHNVTTIITPVSSVTEERAVRKMGSEKNGQKKKGQWYKMGRRKMGSEKNGQWKWTSLKNSKNWVLCYYPPTNLKFYFPVYKKTEKSMAFDLLPIRSFRQPPSTKKFRISKGSLLGFNHLQNLIAEYQKLI